MFTRRHTSTLAAAASIGMALMPASAFAQPAASPEALVVDLWTDFSQTCVPYLVNPEKALAHVPDGVDGFQQHNTPDDSVIHRHEGFLNDYERSRTVQVHIGQAAATVHCEVYRHEDMQPFGPSELAAALRKMTAQLADVNLTGGEMFLSVMRGEGDEQRNYYNGEDTFSSYLLEGALAGRHDFIEIEIAEGLFALYVSATIAREDWK